jgi:hypothetical protein
MNNYGNIDVNAGKIGRHGQLAIQKDTIRKKHWQERWRIGTFKKWFTQIRPGQLANKKELNPVRSSRRAK